MKTNQSKKKPWPTQKAMEQVYEKNLWGSDGTAYYSGEGSHNPEVINPYLKEVSKFLSSLETPPVICDLGCGDFNVGRGMVLLAKKYIGVDIVPGLIERNKELFTASHLEFHCLDIAKDDLPTGDVAIVRQVLQHISNDEVSSVLKRLQDFKFLILTEHIPEGEFEPNKDIISGQGIRLKKKSGLQITAPPFNVSPIEEIELLRIPSKNFKGVIVTTLYRFRKD